MARPNEQPCCVWRFAVGIVSICAGKENGVSSRGNFVFIPTYLAAKRQFYTEKQQRNGRELPAFYCMFCYTKGYNKCVAERGVREVLINRWCCAGKMLAYNTTQRLFIVKGLKVVRKCLCMYLLISQQSGGTNYTRSVVSPSLQLI